MMLCTIGPDSRASRPTTMVSGLLLSLLLSRVIRAKAVVNLTMSIGVRFSPAAPPMVPRMPEIDLISVIIVRSIIFMMLNGEFTLSFILKSAVNLLLLSQ